MYLGHWGLLTIQCLSNSCSYRKGDSILSKFGTKSNLLKAVDNPTVDTGLVLRQSSLLKETGFSVS